MYPIHWLPEVFNKRWPWQKGYCYRFLPFIDSKAAICFVNFKFRACNSSRSPAISAKAIFALISSLSNAVSWLSVVDFSRFTSSWDCSRSDLSLSICFCASLSCRLRSAASSSAFCRPPFSLSLLLRSSFFFSAINSFTRCSACSARSRVSSSSARSSWLVERAGSSSSISESISSSRRLSASSARLKASSSLLRSLALSAFVAASSLLKLPSTSALCFSVSCILLSSESLSPLTARNSASSRSTSALKSLTCCFSSMSSPRLFSTAATPLSSASAASCCSAIHLPSTASSLS
mmetsp:Transcript_2921/g.4437  ORF Transcript_2921/g.4437 Transcript_2921/m.4437 type:complete len:293 (-) Transcript_2921:936-1814(-)